MRKLALILHVTFSVGWLGSVAAFFALALHALQSGDGGGPAYPALALIAWRVIVPACLLSLTTGIIQGLGTQWGLFRHYWVLIKLLITVLATIILMIHMQPISELARLVTDGASIQGADVQGIRLQITVDAGAGIAALLVTTVLSVVKPRGLTAYGWRRQQARAR